MKAGFRRRGSRMTPKEGDDSSRMGAGGVGKRPTS